MKHSLLYIICLFLVSNAWVSAQDIESKLSGNTSAQGFTVKSNNGSSLFTIRGDGKIGVGILNPDALLHLNGQIKISGGSPGVGKILTSDANGLASWTAPITGVTLDQAYDFGGAGTGRTITADAGAVVVAGIDGFISTGTHGNGATLPVSGSGARLIWYPKKSAFRAGAATGSNWDDGNIGNYSTAMGVATKASGLYSVALGDGTTASGQNATAMGHSTSATSMYATAMGSGTNANGDQSTAMGFGTDATASSSTAMGHQTTASGNVSTAMGYQTTASGNTSTAMGSSSVASGSKSIAIGTSVTASGSNSTAMGNYANTNAFDGAFVIGDNSTTTVLNATTPQQFRTRFAGGYQLWSNSAMSIGARLDANATSWGTLSDSTKKCAFRHAEGEHILSRFSLLRLGSWNYIADQNANNRHYGPMAQEWFAAFGHDGIGTIGNDTTLATADVDGVLCIAIQALEKRTSEQRGIIAKQETDMKGLIAKQETDLKAIIAEQDTELKQLRVIVSEMKSELVELRNRSNSVQDDRKTYSQK